MSLIEAILLSALSISSIEQNNQQRESVYIVALEETGCLSTRRMRCGYRLVEASSEKEEKDKRHFNILFYIGADQAEGKEDAISRLDRFFKIKREASSSPGTANIGAIGFKGPVRLRIQGSKYEFSGEDGQKVVVDIEKKTGP